MEKRIRLVWYLTTVTVILILGLQTYWLYMQYYYQQMERSKVIFNQCSRLIQQEEAIREQTSKKTTLEKGKEISPITKFYTGVEFNLSFLENKQKTKIHLVTYKGDSTRSKKMQTFDIEGLNSDAILPLIHRYQLSEIKSFRISVMDSLLRLHGLFPAEDYQFFYTKNYFLNPIYHIKNGFFPEIKIIYPFNPLLKQAVSFYLSIPIQPILKNMFWQLCGSLVLMVVLVICFIFQLKTILIQKRIDGIRRTFLKNMIYEMKQPKIEDESDEANFIPIGNIRFYYSLNELISGNERVIITSRQSEILQILASSLNKLVMREDILNRVWGDDSYSNSMALNVQITYLRRALKSDERVIIEAIMKKGYLLRIQSLEENK
jgi:hypothetical protein